MTPMPTIVVSEKQIENAVKSHSGRCWIAKAIKDTIRGSEKVIVDLQTIRYTGNGTRKTYLTPRQVQVALVAFDQGRKDLLKPFSFTLGHPIHRVKVLPRSQKKLSEKPKVVSQGARRRPTVEGGPEPPLTALAASNDNITLSSSRKRVFGLRILKEMA